MQTKSSDGWPSILKKYTGGKKKINILLSLQTESSDARPKKYRGQKNKIKIFLSIQTEETSNARPSSLKSIGGKKIRLIYWCIYRRRAATDGRQSLKSIRGKNVQRLKSGPCYNGACFEAPLGVVATSGKSCRIADERGYKDRLIVKMLLFLIDGRSRASWEQYLITPPSQQDTFSVRLSFPTTSGHVCRLDDAWGTKEKITVHGYPKSTKSNDDFLIRISESIRSAPDRFLVYFNSKPSHL